MTGASAAVLGLRVLTELLRTSEVHLIISEQSMGILESETGMDWGGGGPGEVQHRVRRHLDTDRVMYWDERDFNSPVASGSYPVDGMFVVPCSMKTLAGIANGYANTLTERAADVAIKEGRPLLLSPREMPFSAIHLSNMLKLARLGVKIAPPVPAFYHQPEGLGDMVNFLAGKILDAMGVHNSLYERWQGK